MQESERKDNVARLMAEALAGQVSRNAALKRASAMKLSAPLVGCVLAAQGRVTKAPVGRWDRAALSSGA